MTCLLELPRRALRPLERVLVRVDDAEHLFFLCCFFLFFLVFFCFFLINLC